MKLLYVSTHQIHNLTPLFREMTKQNKIDLKVVYWQKISSVYLQQSIKKGYINSTSGVIS